MRWKTLTATVVLLGCGSLGCDSPKLVDCSPPTALARDQGRFVRLEVGVWCLYEERSGADCPSSVPEEHRLPWGGFGCASERYESLPPELCAAVGECDGADAGPDGGR